VSDASTGPAAALGQRWRAAGAPDCVILAVSGGSDSMALMRLAAETLKPAGARLVVATVDHALRPGAAGEAVWVADQAKSLGLSHEVLTWAGEKPAAGVQAAARAARYRLLAESANRVGAGAVMTGHTEDDVVETFIMRLSRGAGLAGLAAMRDERFIAAGAGAPVTLVRPLLEITRDALRRYLKGLGQAFLDDPTNHDLSFERARLRQGLAALRGGPDPAMMASSARRLAAAAEAAGQAEARLLRDWGGVFLGWGGACLDAARLTGLEGEMAGAALARIIRAVSGADYRPDPEDAAAACGRALGGGKATLGGAMIERQEGRLYVYREPAALTGRAGVAPAKDLALAPGAAALWDARFVIANRTDQPIRVGAAGAGPVSPLFHGPPAAAASAPAVRGAGRSPVDVMARPLAAERFAERVIRF